MPEFFSEAAFDFMLDGRTVHVPKGRSEQPVEVVNHPFVIAHAVGIPKGRMPVVEGPDGLLIEADEAGQRVTPVSMVDVHGAPTRQEGPVDWHRSPAAVERARANAEAAGAPVLPHDAVLKAQEALDDRAGQRPAADRSSPSFAAAASNEPGGLPAAAGGRHGASTGTTAPNEGGGKSKGG